jgi:hypothetical protein
MHRDQATVLRHVLIQVFERGEIFDAQQLLLRKSDRFLPGGEEGIEQTDDGDKHEEGDGTYLYPNGHVPE